ncbi:septation protein A [Thiolinea disciformis]|uniref:septation protein A n=1 Tax=Thiolinea disciformis TaxID=125614 RepID=UPI000362B757|nr:septation protein A [Thiolinea disciformis]
MKFLVDFFPVVIFFLAYSFFGQVPPGMIEFVNQLPFVDLSQQNPKDAILFATLVIIIATLIQNLIHYLHYKRFEKMHLISLAVLIALGSLTLILKNPDFIKWKVTIINWVFALAFLSSAYIGTRKTLVERMMSQALQVPEAIWKKVNLFWVLFFAFLGAINLVVAYNFEEQIWVKFKLFGVLGLTFVFVIFQALYLQKHAIEPPQES